jgi:hypothetical protein
VAVVDGTILDILHDPIEFLARSFAPRPQGIMDLTIPHARLYIRGTLVANQTLQEIATLVSNELEVLLSQEFPL